MNVYEIITEKIIQRIKQAQDEKKPFYWVKPWTGGAPVPMSYTTGKPYSGINRVLLDAGEYITYNGVLDYKKTQPEDSEIFVKKGSHKCPVFYYGEIEKKDENNNPILDEYGHPSKKRVVRFYQVFNIEDVAGTHSHFPALKTVKTATKDTKLLDKYIKAYTKAENLTVDIVEDGMNCFYRPDEHMVRVPSKEGFKSLYDYYSSVLHELIHSTSKGLNRKLGVNFGNDDYSREELIAQIGSQMLLANFKISATDSEMENDIAYINGWSNKFKNNIKEIANASAQAEKAVRYFMETAEIKMGVKKEGLDEQSKTA